MTYNNLCLRYLSPSFFWATVSETKVKTKTQTETINDLFGSYMLNHKNILVYFQYCSTSTQSNLKEEELYLKYTDAEH